MSGCRRLDTRPYDNSKKCAISQNPISYKLTPHKRLNCAKVREKVTNQTSSQAGFVAGVS